MLGLKFRSRAVRAGRSGNLAVTSSGAAGGTGFRPELGALTADFAADSPTTSPPDIARSLEGAQQSCPPDRLQPLPRGHLRSREDDLEIDSDGEELEELAAYYDGNFDFSVEDRSIYSGKDDNLSNAAMLIQPSCCVSNLECDLPEGCPICLESLEAGQRAWTLPCTHVLHEVCLLRFLRSRLRGRSRATLGSALLSSMRRLPSLWRVHVSSEKVFRADPLVGGLQSLRAGGRQGGGWAGLLRTLCRAAVDFGRRRR